MATHYSFHFSSGAFLFDMQHSNFLCAMWEINCLTTWIVIRSLSLFNDTLIIERLGDSSAPRDVLSKIDDAWLTLGVSANGYLTQ